MPHVYVLKSGHHDLFKVGRTRSDLATRMKQLATGNPDRLSLFAAIQTEHEAMCETYLHRKLRPYKSRASDATEYYGVDVGTMHDAVEDARAFLSEFLPKQKEAERLAKEQSDARFVPPGSAEREIFRQLQEVRFTEDAAKLDRLRLEVALKLAIGTNAGLEGLVAWRSQMTRGFDTASFRAAEPAIYETWVVERCARTFRLL